jgi:phosphomannomutase
MQGNVFVFDVDGTLTEPTLPMSADIAQRFDQWSHGKRFYFATGSDWNGFSKQIKPCLIPHAEGVFVCSGSQYFRKGIENEHIRMEWEPPKELLEFFEIKLNESEYPNRAGEHLVTRTGMFNFSVPGRRSTQREREQYAEWDLHNEERISIQREAQKLFPRLEFHIGGQISIDCYPAGWNKGRVIRYLKEWYPDDRIIYFGDKLLPGGNDYPIIKDLREFDSYYLVRSPSDTISILEEMF